MSPRRHRLDDNHREIRRAAEAAGWLWEDTSQTPLGYDALVTFAGRTIRIEIKDSRKPPSQQQLTPHEAAVHRRLEAHGVTVELITCVEDLLALASRPASGLHSRRRDVL